MRIWLEPVDYLVADMSWEATRQRMSALTEGVITEREDAGAMVAERLANKGGKRVLVVDRRPHVDLGAGSGAGR